MKILLVDDHQMVRIDLHVRSVPEDILDKLVSRLYSLKTIQRYGILDTRIVGVKGDDVLNTHADQFLQGQGAVQGFSAGALVLAAFIEEGHDYIDPAGFAAHGCDDALQILEMVIRGHMVFMPAEGVGE